MGLHSGLFWSVQVLPMSEYLFHQIAAGMTGNLIFDICWLTPLAIKKLNIVCKAANL
jgi:hypothetical protein